MSMKLVRKSLGFGKGIRKWGLWKGVFFVNGNRNGFFLKVSDSDFWCGELC